MTRVAVVDLGSNSSRLLIADVAADGTVSELVRRSTVTRLGQGVDATGRLADEAVARVDAVLTDYRALMDAEDVERDLAVLTSAVRDADNGAAFTEHVRTDFRLDARTIPGEEEARLSFTGATSTRRPDAEGPVVVIDIGGGSTELVVGDHGAVAFRVSTQAGSVRHGERHLHHDPAEPEELQALAADVRAVLADGVPDDVRHRVRAGVAVAGTATQLAAIDQALEPYDPLAVHGYRLTEAAVERMLARLAQMDLREREEVAGLDPARAPTIVPGCILMQEVLRHFGLDEVEVSEHDILHGAALHLAGLA